MAVFNHDAFQAALNADPEFTIAGRFLTSSWRLGIGDEGIILIFRDGKLTDIRPDIGQDNWDVEISAPANDWQEMLADVPKPFYQDPFSAAAQHNFRLGAGIETIYAYSRAVQRMVEIMRANAA